VEICDERIRELLEANVPVLLGIQCCGTSPAAALVVAAGDNLERMRSEAAFASLCGVSPIPASSGKTARHRLNRGGNRQANWALCQIAIKRMAYDERTIAYASKRTAEGKSRKEIIRCLKRYIAREVYHVLLNPNPEDAAPTGRISRRCGRRWGLPRKKSQRLSAPGQLPSAIWRQGKHDRRNLRNSTANCSVKEEEMLL